jgi:hypothetical protein
VNEREGWGWVALLAVLWGIGPLLPAIFSGQIPGTPWTDLYPSVWGLSWFASHVGDVLPRFAPELGAPAGSAFYYSSPLHGWLAAVLIPLIGLRWAYITGVVAARMATVACAYGAGRALGLGIPGGLTLAAVYGASPFFHGYAVEGIIEGNDGWTLALWVWMAARGRTGLAALAAGLTVLSSWYLGLAGSLLALGVAWWSPRAFASWLGGVVLASPSLVMFFCAFAGGHPLLPEVRAAMGSSLSLLPRPGVLPGTYPFAKTSWIGAPTLVLAGLGARRNPRLAVAAAILWLLSLGIGPIYLLPLWRAVRFPYRIHAATLLVLGKLAGDAVDEPSRLSDRVKALASVLLIAGSGWLLSPIEPIVPGSPAEVPAVYAGLRGKVVLAIPGPVAMPPGKVNPSRQRARYLLYDLAVTGTRTPWAFDWNGLGSTEFEASVLENVRTWDRLYPSAPVPFTLEDLRRAGIDAIIVHGEELGDSRTQSLRAMLSGAGARITAEDGEITRWEW